MEIKFIKIDAHLLHEMARGDAPNLNMRALKGALDRVAMDLIVEKIENEEMLKDLLDLQIDFGQGYLAHQKLPQQPIDDYQRNKWFKGHLTKL